VNPSIFIFGCVALGSALVFVTACAYKWGKYQGWKDALGKFAPYERADMTLDKGETLAAVVEMRKGKYFFLGINTRQNSPLE
jgi:hypothetical protein